MTLQQEALGIVGVNLLYGAFFLHHKPELMLESLLDNLTTERIEIDMIEFSGIEFRHVDNRVMSLKLVQLGLSGAAMFGPSGEVLQPSEVLRKRPILVERGSFRPVTKVNIDMINSARERFAAEPEVQGRPVVELMEITMRNLLAAGKLDLSDFLARADVLAAAGKTVLISDYFEYYRLAAYLTRYSSEPIAVTMGVSSLRDLFKEEYYAGLEGGILEAFGKLFTKDLRIYVYPLRDRRPASSTPWKPCDASRDPQPVPPPGGSRPDQAARQFRRKRAAHLLARRPEANQRSRRCLGADGAARDRRGDQDAAGSSAIKRPKRWRRCELFAPRIASRRVAVAGRGACWDTRGYPRESGANASRARKAAEPKRERRVRRPDAPWSCRL